MAIYWFCNLNDTLLPSPTISVIVISFSYHSTHAVLFYILGGDLQSRYSFYTLGGGHVEGLRSWWSLSKTKSVFRKKLLIISFSIGNELLLTQLIFILLFVNTNHNLKAYDLYGANLIRYISLSYQSRSNILIVKGLQSMYSRVAVAHCTHCPVRPWAMEQFHFAAAVKKEA